MNFGFISTRPVIPQYEDNPHSQRRTVWQQVKLALPYAIIFGLLVATYFLH